MRERVHWSSTLDGALLRAYTAVRTAGHFKLHQAPFWEAVAAGCERTPVQCSRRCAAASLPACGIPCHASSLATTYRAVACCFRFARIRTPQHRKALLSAMAETDAPKDGAGADTSASRSWQALPALPAR